MSDRKWIIRSPAFDEWGSERSSESKEWENNIPDRIRTRGLCIWSRTLYHVSHSSCYWDRGENSQINHVEFDSHDCRTYLGAASFSLSACTHPCICGIFPPKLIITVCIVSVCSNGRIFDFDWLMRFFRNDILYFSTNKSSVAHIVEHSASNTRVSGSNPV